MQEDNITNTQLAVLQPIGKPLVLNLKTTQLNKFASLKHLTNQCSSWTNNNAEGSDVYITEQSNMKTPLSVVSSSLNQSICEISSKSPLNQPIEEQSPTNPTLTLKTFKRIPFLIYYLHQRMPSPNLSTNYFFPTVQSMNLLASHITPTKILNPLAQLIHILQALSPISSSNPNLQRFIASNEENLEEEENHQANIQSRSNLIG